MCPRCSPEPPRPKTDWPLSVSAPRSPFPNHATERCSPSAPSPREFLVKVLGRSPPALPRSETAPARRPGSSPSPAAGPPLPPSAVHRRHRLGERFLLRNRPFVLEFTRLVAKGYRNKTITGVLEINSRTVSTHRRRLFAKLGCGSRAAMVAALLGMGLLGESVAALDGRLGLRYR